MRYLFVLCFLWSAAVVSAQQRVGLVLSGGGAKGITHIGVIKALEEHGIPIDYVAGTSMGAIVGGMYASGMSPEETNSVCLLPTSRSRNESSNSSDFNALSGRWYAL